MNKSLLATIISGFAVLLIFYGCAKGPGPGGQATIQGRVYSTNYSYDNSSATFVAADSGYLGDASVFISYGDRLGTDDNVDTDFDGHYAINFLRPGKYVIWVYSKNLKNNSLDQAIIQNVEITSKKQVIIAPEFKIKTLKN